MTAGIPFEDELHTRYSQHVGALTRAPYHNPVSQLAYEISRELEASEISLDDLSQAASRLAIQAFQDRKNTAHRLVAPTAISQNRKRLASLLTASAEGGDFDAFAAEWQTAKLGCVFTAHPTTLLNGAGYQQLCDGKPDANAITPNEVHRLSDEHDAAMTAMAHLAKAAFDIDRMCMDQATTSFGKKGLALRPTSFDTGTWVGYDMDGRTDISWATSFQFRMREKHIQLGFYIEALGALKNQAPLTEIIATLTSARQYNSALIAELDIDTTNVKALNTVANAISAEHPDKLTSLAPIAQKLEHIFPHLDEDDQKTLAVIIATMRQKGLGVGTVHFRLNAAQINNAIRRRLQDTAEFDEKSLSSITTMTELLRDVKPVKVNFASLTTETTTALRQFIVMAQILKHIDTDSPIRMLIAECDHAITVMVALYFARLFGIDDKVDISPLFETEHALEHGARILDTLLGDAEVQKAARLRGRVCIQTGFSDAGRFFGQIPATLAIERLQGHFARLMAKHGLHDVTALVFNTHGESMGRGAHPSSIAERLDYAFSPWAARQFEKEAVTPHPEVSFQGGDGFLRFGSDDMAMAFLVRVLEARAAMDLAKADDDPFYSDLDVSLDFYRSVRRYQVQLWNNKSYNRAITAFGLALLPVTGSRKSRRQSDIANSTGAGLSRIRAIPHNAILQQLGYPLNVVAGIGEATDFDHDRFINLIKRSERAMVLMKMVFGSKRLSSIKTLVSYGQLFDGAYWATRPYSGNESQWQGACLELAEMLTADDRTPAFRSLATLLRVDSTKLHKIMDAVFEKEQPPQKDALAILHAIRQALIQHMFLKAVQIPPFSRRNDMSREDIIRMLFDLRVDEVVTLLKDSYPVDHPVLEDFDMAEEANYPEDPSTGYARINTRFITPIEEAGRIMHTITTAIAHHWGAFG